MANGGTIKYKVGFDVDSSGLNAVKTSLAEIKKLTTQDILKLNPNFNGDVSKAAEKLNEIRQTATHVEDALRQAFNAKLNTYNIEAFHKAINASQGDITSMAKKLQSAGVAGQNAFRSLASSVLHVNPQLKETHEVLNKIATTLGNTVKWNLSSAAINGISNSIQQAYGYVKSLDTSLNDIRIVTNKSAEDMGNFAIQANEAAKALGATTMDYTKAALIYAQQGLSDEEVKARSEITLKTANVTGQSAKEVSDQLTAVWNGYKVTADQAEVYVDRLAAVAAGTASDLEELSTGMSKVASAAAAMGVGEEQLAAQLSTIISVTKQAPESVGTALRTVYARISDIKAGIDEDGVTLGNYSSKMAELGFNVLDMSGNLRDMGEVMEEIGGKWGDLTRQQQVYLAQTMAGQRQYNNLLALFDNFDQYEDALEMAQNAVGTLNEQQEIYMDSAKAHLNQLRASTEQLYSALIDTDSIKSVADALSGLTTFTAKFVESIGGGVGVLRTLGSVAVTVFSNQIAQSISKTITNFQTAKENAQQLAATLAQSQSMRQIAADVGFDQETQDLMAYREQLILLKDSMSPDMFSETQQAIDNLTESLNQRDLVQAQQDAITETINKIIEQGQEFKNVQEILEDPTAYDKVIDKINEQALKFSECSDTAKEFKRVLSSLGQDAASMEPTRENIQEIKDQLVASTIELQRYLKTLSEVANDSGMSDQAKRVMALKAALEQVDFNKLAPSQIIAKLQQINAIASGIASNLANTTKGLGQELQKDFGGTLDGLAAQEQKFADDAAKYGQQAGENLAKGAQTSVIENYVKLAGGIAQVGNAIQSVKNLGSIWSDKDISVGEKLLKTVTNLAVVIPTLYNGVSKAGTAIKLLSQANQAGTISAGTHAAAEGVAAGAIKTTGTAAVTTTAAVSALNIALLGIASIIGIIAIVASAIKQHNQEIIDSNNEAIEAEKKKQETLANEQDFIDAVDELNNQYKNGSISRYELTKSIEALGQEYSIEESKIDSLISKYGDLSEAILKAKKDIIEAEKISAGVELGKAQSNFVAAAKDKGYKSNVNYSTLGTYGYGSTDKSAYQYTSEILKSILDKNDYQYIKPVEQRDSLTGGQYRLKLIFDVQNPDAARKALLENEKFIADLEKEYTEKYGADGIQMLEKMEPAYKKALQTRADFADILPVINEAAEKYDNILSKQAAINTSLFNPNDAKNSNEYLQQKRDLTQELINLGKEATQAETLATDYLKKNARQAYNDFEGVGEKLEVIKGEVFDQMLRNFNGQTSMIMDAIGLPSEQVINAAAAKFKPISDIIDILNNKQADLVKGLDLKSYANDLDSLEKLLTHISQLSFSNLQGIKGMGMAAEGRSNTYEDFQNKINAGRTISTTEFENLDARLQPFFTSIGDGIYGMTGRAEEFNAAVNNIQLQGFESAMDQIERRANSLSSFNDSGASYKDISIDMGAAYQNGAIDNSALQESVDLQLKYLEAVYATDPAQMKIIENWQAANEKGQITAENAHDIAQAVKDAGDQTGKLKTEAQELGEYSDELAEKMYRATHPLDDDLDQDTVSAYADHLKNMVENADEATAAIDGLDESLATDAAKRLEVAEATLRFNDGIQDMIDNYADWYDILNDYPDEAYTIIEDLRDGYADVLDLSQDAANSLSDSFLSSADNLELMRQAVNGNVQAYNQLAQAAAKDICIKLGMDDTQFYNAWNSVDALIQSVDGYNLQVGATLDAGPVIDGLNQMLAAGEITVDQLSSILTGMGFNANMKVATQETQEPKTQTSYSVEMGTATETGTWMKFSGQGEDFTGEQVPYTVTYPYPIYHAEQMQTTDIKTNSAAALEIESLNKRAGGDLKFNNSTLGGGSQGSKRKPITTPGGTGKTSPGGGNSGKKKSPKKSGGGKKGGGGGGGSGKAKEPDTSTKQKKQLLEDERDIYHDINIELDQINRSLKRVQDQQDRLYGKKLLDNLNKQSEILETHKTKLKEKIKLQQGDLAQKKEALILLGAQFDAYGNMTNYMLLVEQAQKAVNAEIEKENALIEKYNNDTDADRKKEISKQIEEQSKATKKAEEALKKLQDKIKDYDELRESIEDIVDMITDETQQQIEIEIKKFRMSIEIRLQMGEAQRDWNKFVRKVIAGDSVNDTKFAGIYKDAKYDSLANLKSYFETDNGGLGSIQALTNQLNGTAAQIDKINAGLDSIYGDNKAQAMEDMEKDWKQLMSQMEDVVDLIRELDEAYLDTIDDVKDGLDEQLEVYELINKQIQHDMDLLTLLYGDKNYDAMNNYYTQLNANNLQQLDFLKKQKDFWKQQYNIAINDGDTAAAQKFYDNYLKTIDKLNSAITDSVKNLRDKYVNAIDKIFDELDKKISNGKGTEYLSMEWELMKKNADEYLDTINSAFALQKLGSKFEDALDATQSIKGQRALKKLMDEQLANLKAKDKLTQYDVDRAEKLLQIEQARIALQEAQNNKTTMRLKRDSQGNYSYEYVADQNGIQEAQQSLLDAQEELYNFDKDRYNANLEDMLAAWQDFQKEYKDILLDMSLSDEERQARLKLLQDEYAEYIDNKQNEIKVSRQNLNESAFMSISELYNSDLARYTAMTNNQTGATMQMFNEIARMYANNTSNFDQMVHKIIDDKTMGKLVPQWNSGVQAMSDAVNGNGGFLPTCQESFENIIAITQTYENELDKMAEVAGINLDSIKEGTDEVIGELKDLIINNDDLIAQMTNQIETIRNLRAEAYQLMKQYQGVWQAAMQAMQAIKDLQEAERKKAADESDPFNEYGSDEDETPAPAPEDETPAPAPDEDKGKIDITDDLIDGIAGNIWWYGTWGNNPDRYNNFIKKFGEEQGPAIYRAVQDQYNIYDKGYKKPFKYPNMDYYKDYALSKFDTGGYTGTWTDGFGKLALLHQKELVLNQQDTRNILDSVSILRGIMANVGNSVLGRLSNLTIGNPFTASDSSSIEQQVHIQASFPNVNSKKEIEEAFTELVNLAAQRALRRK